MIKNNKFFIYTSLSIIFLFFLVILNSCKDNNESRKKILKIYNWADYIDEDLLTEFPIWYKEQTGEDVEIVYQVYDMTEVMYTKIALGHEDFDLVCPSQYNIERMMKYNLLLPIDTNFGNTPNYIKNISPYFVNLMNTMSIPGKNVNDFAVPYMWGTSGILYNAEFITAEEASWWSSFWNPKNKGKILMKDNYWDVYNVAAIYGYYNDIQSGKETREGVTNNHTDENIAMVEKQLKLLKPNLAGWEADFGKEMMTKGKIWMNYAWSGDAVWAIEEAASVDVTLDYIVPNEGSNIWFDGWVIPKYAKNVKAASYFLNYLCQSEIAIRNMDISGYTSAVSTDEILDYQTDTTLTETVNASYFFGPGNDSLQLNPIQYPDSSIVSRCVVIQDFLDKNEIVLEMWSRAKGDNLNEPMAISIFIFFMVLTVFLIYRKFRKIFKKSKRKQLNISK